MKINEGTSPANADAKKMELTDEQMERATGGLSARNANHSCDKYQHSEEYLAVRGAGFRVLAEDYDCVNCAYWDGETYSCTLGFFSEPRLFDPNWDPYYGTFDPDTGEWIK